MATIEYSNQLSLVYMRHRYCTYPESVPAATVSPTSTGAILLNSELLVTVVCRNTLTSISVSKVSTSIPCHGNTPWLSLVTPYATTDSV